MGVVKVGGTGREGENLLVGSLRSGGVDRVE